MSSDRFIKWKKIDGRCSGNTLKTYTDSNIDDCKQKCLDNPECKYAQLHKNDNCRLKSDQCTQDNIKTTSNYHIYTPIDVESAG